MTDPEDRAINRAICLLGDEHQDEREAARAALHTLFRRRRRYEKALREIAEWDEWESAPIARQALDTK
jgi:hypothetical protein